MNEKQPYEKHLREKLQQVAPPGNANGSWSQMRHLLDRHMPEEKDRPGGGWWLLLLVMVIMLGGIWVLTQKAPAPKPLANTQTSSPAHSGAVTPAAANPETGSAQPVSANPAPSSPETPNEITGRPASPSGSENQLQASAPDISDRPDAHGSGAPASRSSDTKNNLPGHSQTNAPAVASAGSSHSPGVAGIPPRLQQTVSKRNPRAASIPNPASITGDLPLSAPTERSLNYSTVRSTPVSLSAVDFTSGLESLLPMAAFARPEAAPVDKMQIRRWIRFGIKDKSARSGPRLVGSGTHKDFAFGLSLPLAFPLADQKPVGYNFNAGANTATDYLPSPHFQYHFNDKSYLQTELQFVSPQYIQPVLLSAERVDLPQGSSYQYLMHSVYARKLYYFNLPVGIHYSPFRHFYLGTGLQFSTLLSGIAQFDDMAYSSTPGSGGTLLNQDFRRFRNDSLSAKLSNSEFRLMLDANYYWKRFTVGFRYNQALSNYVDIQVLPNTDYFQDKNKSLQFYLRYNLWEIKKKGQSPKPLLTSK